MDLSRPDLSNICPYRCSCEYQAPYWKKNHSNNCCRCSIKRVFILATEAIPQNRESYPKPCVEMFCIFIVHGVEPKIQTVKWVNRRMTIFYYLEKYMCTKTSIVCFKNPLLSFSSPEDISFRVLRYFIWRNTLEWLCDCLHTPSASSDFENIHIHHRPQGDSANIDMHTKSFEWLLWMSVRRAKTNTKLHHRHSHSWRWHAAVEWFYSGQPKVDPN